MDTDEVMLAHGKASKTPTETELGLKSSAGNSIRSDSLPVMVASRPMREISAKSE